MKKIIYFILPMILQSCGISLTDYRSTAYYKTSTPVHDHKHITLLDTDKKAKDIGGEYTYLEGEHEFALNYDQRLGRILFATGSLFGNSDFNKKKIEETLPDNDDFRKHQRGIGGQIGIGANADLNRFILQTQFGGSLMSEKITLKNPTAELISNGQFEWVENTTNFENSIRRITNTTIIGYKLETAVVGIGCKYQYLVSDKNMMTGYWIKREIYDSLLGSGYHEEVHSYLDGKNLNTLNPFIFGRLQMLKHIYFNVSINVMHVINRNYKNNYDPGLTMGLNYNFSEFKYKK